MSNWNTRQEIGLRNPTAILTNVNPTKGVGCHYGGVGPFKRDNHKDCQAIWRSWQAYHMSDGNKNNYVDIAYNLGVCHHGVILEGRSTQNRPKVRGGANGNFQVNSDRMSIVMLWGREDGEPTFNLLNAWLVARAFLMTEAGAGSGITPHRDMASTACPGDFITEWIRSDGAKLPATPVPPKFTPKPQPAPQAVKEKWDGKSFPGADAFKLGVKHPAVTLLDKRLIVHDFDKHHDGDGYQAGPTFTEWTLRNVKDFQQNQGWKGKDANGYPGPVTWKRLMLAPKRRQPAKGYKFPGSSVFKLGKRSKYITLLDKRLISRGYTKHHDGDGYQAGPTFTKYTLLNVQDFQEAQGWRGSDADGYPGPVTWARLFK